jgi:hypothetical protein
MVEHQFESLHFAYLPDHHLADHFADPDSVPVPVLVFVFVLVLVLVLVFDLAVLLLLTC